MKQPARGIRAVRKVTPADPGPVSGNELLGFPLDRRQLTAQVKHALTEDGAFNDITTIATVLSDRRARAALVARSPGVIAGVPFALTAFRQLDSKVVIRVDADDGARATAGSSVMFISGHARAMLSAERVALNYLQRLSGIASLTAQYVDAVRGTRARILDTRKTTPGMRALEKYAVRAGGGMNHRLDLSEAILIKDNHLASVGGDVALAVQRARKLAPEGTRIEIECDSEKQVQAALDSGADIVLLDNMSVQQLERCVAMAAGRALTEASGGISLQTVRDIAESGVDWISIGALTHSAPALDLALDFESLA